MRKQTQRNQDGFTLVETAIVITVFGILLSFVTVAWLSMKSSQQISSAGTVLQTVSNCLQDYVIHSKTIPPQSYFTQHCADTDPWGSNILYYNNGDDVQVSAVVTKTVRDTNGDHVDGAFIVVSSGPDRTLQMSSSATLWDCSSGDDLCNTTSKNTLIYETNR